MIAAVQHDAPFTSSRDGILTTTSVAHELCILDRYVGGRSVNRYNITQDSAMHERKFLPTGTHRLVSLEMF